MHSNQLKIIVLVGATGLIGSRLLEALLTDVTVNKLIVLSRRPLERKHPKLELLITDFHDLDGYAEKLSGAGILYCCIGTTMRKAGSKEAFREVDYQLPLKLAELASKAGIKKFIAVSSVGADPSGTNFYLRTKGEMERDITASFRFQKLAFLRPSMLLGPRTEFRFGERVGQLFMILLSPFMRGRMARYKPIHDFTVAKAMISISNSVNNQRVYESPELEWLGK